jgi:DNA polymerase III delta prime subunit
MALNDSRAPERENKAMRKRLQEISERLQALAGNEGLNFGQLFKKALDESSSIKEIYTRTGAIRQAVDLIGAVVEKRLGGIEDPIVDVQLEAAN